MELEFQYKRVTRDIELESLAELAKLCFNMDVDRSYFEWKYFDNPCGEVVAYVALSHNKIVAFYGVIPEWYWENGKVVKIFQSMDTMTHPDFRRLGLFVKLANRCFDDLAKENPDYLVLGFPAPASYSGFVKKLGWTSVFFSNFWFCYSFVFKIFTLTLRFSKEISFRSIDTTSPIFEQYFKKKKPLNVIEKFVDASIFKWKITENKHKKYESIGIYESNSLIGIAVYYLDTPKSCQLVWVDFCDSLSNSQKIVGGLVKHLFSATKRRCVYIWEPTTNFQKYVFSKIGFIVNPFSKGPFSQKFSFITSARGNREGLSFWHLKSNHNFQGIMLD